MRIRLANEAEAARIAEPHTAQQKAPVLLCPGTLGPHGSAMSTARLIPNSGGATRDRGNARRNAPPPAEGEEGLSLRSTFATQGYERLEDVMADLIVMAVAPQTRKVHPQAQVNTEVVPASFETAGIRSSWLE